MSAGAVEITAIVVAGVLAFAGLAVVAMAREWVSVSASASVKAIPAAKRQPRNAVELVHVLPGTAEPAGEVKPIAVKRGAAS